MIVFVYKALDNENGYFIPKEFEYPSSKIDSGKTFIYQNSLTKQHSLTDLKLMNVAGKIFRTIKNYDSTGATSDSSKIYDGKAIEVYNFFMANDGTRTKADIIQDTILNDGHKLGIHLTKSIYRTKHTTNEIASIGQYLKDTTITWKNTLVPVLVITNNSVIELRTNTNGIKMTHTIKVFSNQYFGQGIGLIKYSVYFKDHTGKDNYNVWDLKSIENLKK